MIRSLVILLLSLLTIAGCKPAQTAITKTPVVAVTNKSNSDTTVKKSKITAVLVDSHGVALDTDKDGIPDYRDKELLTHQSCFPVDEDGIGNCPEPACCDGFINHSVLDSFPVSSCSIEPVAIKFKPKSILLSKQAREQLYILSAYLKLQPDCKVVIGTASGSDKASIDVGWKRVKTVINFLTAAAISEDRFIFGIHVTENTNEVALRGTNESAPNSIPAPKPVKRQ